MVDESLFRIAVQYGRIWAIKKLIKFGEDATNKKQFYNHVFYKFKFEGEELTVLDLISSLEADAEK